MFPGMNQRKMNQMMKKMGIQQQEIPATEVIIRTEDKDIVIQDPQVSKVNMMGQMTYQVVGEAVEKPREAKPVEINEDDINTVIEQAGVSADKARELLQKNDGDIAATIMELREEKGGRINSKLSIFLENFITIPALPLNSPIII